MKSNKQKGFSVIEVLLAAGLFVVFSIGVVVALLQGLNMNRLGQEETIATQYATEGVEAARSIRNRSYASLVETPGTGIDRVGGVWDFSGENNVLDGKYTRTIVIAEVQRDGDGNVVESGGTIDPDTKKVTVTVSWQAAAQQNSVVLTTYLTDWKLPL